MSLTVKKIKNNLTKKQINKCINYLEDFCKSQGWEVEYSATTRENKDFSTQVSNWGGKIILWNKNRRVEILYYIFLHELGHLLMKLKDITYNDRYAVMLENRYATDTYKILRVQEEMEAWDVGLRFARDNKLKINDRKFQKIKAECLMSYMLWVTKRRRKKIEKISAIKETINVNIEYDKETNTK